MAGERETTEQAIMRAIARFADREPDDMSGTLLLADDLDVDDAFGRQSLAFVLEERFGVELSEDAIAGWLTVADVMRSLQPVAEAGHA